jgi:DNA polymerase iota
VSKLMSIVEARRVCPAVVLVPGEDLTPYRAASKRLLAVLQRFGTVERGGLDEAFVDATALVRRRLTDGTADGRWHGHVYAAACQLDVTSNNRHRPMDLRMHGISHPSPPSTSARAEHGARLLLQVGSAVAADARAALRAEAGLRTAAGVAHSKVVAKLCSGLHKPDDQTSVPKQVRRPCVVTPASQLAVALTIPAPLS